jgi:hypothetical protein
MSLQSKPIVKSFQQMQTLIGRREIGFAKIKTAEMMLIVLFMPLTVSYSEECQILCIYMTYEPQPLY